MIFIRIVGYLLLLFSLVGFGTAFLFFSDSKAISEHPVSTKAEIIEARASDGGSVLFKLLSGNSKFNFKIRYVVDGKEYAPTRGVDAAAFYKHKIGDSVQIRYAADRPRSVEIPGISTPFDPARTFAIPGLMFLGGFLMLVLFRKRRR